MNRKRIFLLLIYLVVMSLISSSVFAAKNDDKNYMPEILEEFFEFLFFTLPEGARSGDDNFVVYFKIILWLLLFTIFYFGTKKVFDDNKIAGTIALIFALISAILIPKEILFFVFVEYSAVASILLGLLPLFLGIYIRHKIPEELVTIRNAILILVGALGIFVGGFFVAFESSGTGEGIYSEMGQYASLGGAVALIWGVLGLIIGFQFFEGTSKAKERAAREKGKGKTPEQEEKEEDEALEKAEKKELRDEIRDTVAEIKIAKEVHDKIKTLRNDLIKVKNEGPSDWPAEISKYDARIGDLIRELKEIEALDRDILKHTERILDLEKTRGKTGEARKRVSSRRKLSSDIKAAIDTSTFINQMVIDAETKLVTTKGIPRLIIKLKSHFASLGEPYPPMGPYGTPPPDTFFTAADVEFNVLQDVMDEMKKVYNTAAKLYKTEKGMGVRIQEIS